MHRSPSPLNARLIRQAWRFFAVGIASNAAAYVAFLLLSKYLLGPKSAMTACFILAFCASFLLNRSWTFSDSGAISRPLFRYLILYLAGYLLNLTALWWLVDQVGWNPAWVQLALVVVIAGLTFIGQRLWVFR
ncbi:MAG: GtrA family protein [Phycisphaerales bacterium]|nr:GtrA family protein [Phycisphaerales bacterium]